MSTESIYCLCDPDTGAEMYVGRTSMELADRLAGHMAQPSNSRMDRWITRLLRARKRPVIRLLETVPAEGAAAAEEVGEGDPRAEVARAALVRARERARGN